MASFPKEITLDIKANFQIARPGDTIIIALKNLPDHELTAEEVDYFGEFLKSYLPNEVTFLVIPEAEMVVYKPDGTPRNPSSTETREEGQSPERVGYDDRTTNPPLPVATSDNAVYYEERARSDAPSQPTSRPARSQIPRHRES